MTTESTSSGRLTEKEVIDKLLRDRYFFGNDASKEDVYHRAAFGVGAPNAQEIFTLMKENVFLPNTPTLANAGTNRGTLSACFVLPIEDSLEGIYKACREMGAVHRYFGGTGFSFTSIRPEGTPVRSTGGGACGPVSVLRLLNQNADMVRQGGKREGANMGILHVDHPDFFKWISCKDNGGLAHFNLSVAVTDKFMRHPDERFDAICEHAWKTGDPGLIFIDTINKDHPLGVIEATNPCGEQPLMPYESCNLGSINLGTFATDPNCDVTDIGFDLGSFDWTVDQCVHYLDCIIDANRYPLPEIEAATKMTRKIGLGVMGWADCLNLLGIPYASDEALNLIDYIGKSMYRRAIITSEELAETYGPFAEWSPDYPDNARRNVTLLTIAPTGTLHKLAHCSPSIEPVYAWEHDIFTEAGTYHYTYPLMPHVVKHGLEDQVAHKIPVEMHIRHQAYWQHHVDNAVSKTINLPNDATVEDVRKSFNLAWNLGCKGITIYRDKSKETQVLTIGAKGMGKTCKFNRRPGHLYEVQSGCGTLYSFITPEDDSWKELRQIFVISAGGCVANNEMMGRVLSEEMQAKMDLLHITGPLRKVKCINAMKNPNSEGKSCADIVGQIIETEYQDFIKKDDMVELVGVTVHYERDKCPSCGAPLTRWEGCAKGTCPACGWDGCS